MTAPAVFEGKPYIEDVRGLDRAGFVVCAFFSAGDGYERYAQRLAASCRRFDLPHSIWQTPTVHCSISLRGSPDLRFTKPSFIGSCLGRFSGAGIAYLDVDTLFMAPPQALFEARATGCDLAIYNWLADAHNETYLPANHKVISDDRKSALYVFSHRVEWRSTEQLICSGVTQFYGDSALAHTLLGAWQQVIAHNPRAADDQCLNYAFNNCGPGAGPLRAMWLDKAYARSPWWPHVEPVVLHPAIPALGQLHSPVSETDERRCVYLDRCTKNDEPVLFPRDGGIDVSTGVEFHVDAEGRLQAAGRYEGRFWIYPEDPAPGQLS